MFNNMFSLFGAKPLGVYRAIPAAVHNFVRLKATSSPNDEPDLKPRYTRATSKKPIHVFIIHGVCATLNPFPFCLAQCTVRVVRTVRWRHAFRVVTNIFVLFHYTKFLLSTVTPCCDCSRLNKMPFTRTSCVP